MLQDESKISVQTYSFKLKITTHAHITANLVKYYIVKLDKNLKFDFHKPLLFYVKTLYNIVEFKTI